MPEVLPFTAAKYITSKDGWKFSFKFDNNNMKFHCFENIWSSQQRQSTHQSQEIFTHIHLLNMANMFDVRWIGLFIDRRKYTFQKQLQRLASYTFIVNVAKIVHILKKQTQHTHIIHSILFIRATYKLTYTSTFFSRRVFSVSHPIDTNFMRWISSISCDCLMSSMAADSK